jgi:hypothetical protein
MSAMTAPQKLPTAAQMAGEDALLHITHRVDGYKAHCWHVPPGMTPAQLYSTPVTDRELLWAGLYDEDRCLTVSLTPLPRLVNGELPSG